MPGKCLASGFVRRTAAILSRTDSKMIPGAPIEYCPPKAMEQHGRKIAAFTISTRALRWRSRWPLRNIVRVQVFYPAGRRVHSGSICMIAGMQRITP